MPETAPHTLLLPVGGHTLAIDATPTGRVRGPGAPWTLTIAPIALLVAGLGEDELRPQAIAALRTAYPGRSGTAMISLAAGIEA